MFLENCHSPQGHQKRSKNATSIFHQPVSASFRIQNYLEFSFSISCCASIADVCRFLTFYHFASSDRCPWGAAVSLCVYNDILKVLAPKIKHLAPQGRTKTLQKRIRNVTLIFHGFYIDFGSHVGDILKVLAASSSKYRLVSCFQMVRFNGQYLKVSAVAPQLQ